ncbi:biotin transporter BioY [Curtobacterium flaccumfaciens pv. flaccumfaciens]|uniref:biotin transporter BioY n=1 Tax=Curtobacterium flaccumfaciens TaxID=2035 RepID=UPI0021B0FB12|nr:biotin transporter BioY [Curtobacterium flaccumfaciens]QYI96257.1 biotin transporter BioY [Curtobacterium flaccumfaciens pv. flaccumfaciens]
MRSARESHWRLDATDVARAAVFAGCIAALGLPGAFTAFGGVPITAQTLGVMLAGAVLGPRLGALSVTLLLALVAVGMPLLAGGRGGVAVFVSPTGGYDLGWVLGAFVIGAIVHAGGRKPVWWRTVLGTVVGGIVVIYAVGIPVQSAVTHLPLAPTVLASLVFVPGDLLKAAIATFVVHTLARSYPRAFRQHRWSGAVRAPEPIETQR